MPNYDNLLPLFQFVNRSSFSKYIIIVFAMHLDIHYFYISRKAKNDIQFRMETVVIYFQFSTNLQISVSKLK